MKNAFLVLNYQLLINTLFPYNELSLDTSKKEYSEDETTNYIYRQFEDFGIGHGCSVKWDKKLNTIESEYIPICDTPDVDPTT